MKINIQRLSEGLHEFSEEFLPEDLDLLEPVNSKGKILIKAQIDKFEESYRVKVNIKADLLHTCDKCLNEFIADFDETIDQIYQIGENKLGDDEIEILPKNVTELNLSNIINEIFLISRPIRKICKSNCKGLCPSCGIDLNVKSCRCNENNIDPRLEKLKSLIK